METVDATRQQSQVDPVMLAQDRTRRWVHPQRIPFEDRATARSRPGWPDNRPANRGTGLRQQRENTTVHCYGCYQPGHIQPDCLLDIQRQPNVVTRNYEALPREILRSIPATSYWTARDILDARGNEAGSSTEPRPREAERHPRVLANPERETARDPNAQRG